MIATWDDGEPSSVPVRTIAEARGVAWRWLGEGYQVTFSAPLAAAVRSWNGSQM